MKITLFLITLLSIPILLAYSESMELGKIYWKDDIISANSFAEVNVEDNDMNKKEYPNFADKFKIKVWSDSSTQPIDLQVLETGIFSGKFKGRIFISDIPGEGKKLFAKPGDTVYASYIDTTVPQSDSSSELIAKAVIKIKGVDMNQHIKEVESKIQVKSQVPQWVKNNAGWWADGSISELDFVQGMQYLIAEGVLVVPPTDVTGQASDGIPEWVKNNARWWSDGIIEDNEFINGIQYLMSVGTISFN